MNDSFELDRVAIRMVKESPLYSDVNLNSPQAVVKLMADTLKDMDREVFAVVNLRTDLKPINVNFVSVGAMNEAMVHPREVLKSIVLSNSLGVMLVHNHVTGNSKPSPSDITLTDRLAQLCGLLGVQLYDHVIVGPGDTYYSFAEKDALPVPSFHLARSMDELEIGGLKVAEETEMKTQKKVSFTVAECGEFHNMGEFHENVANAKEAIAILKSIPGERMNGIPTIGIRVADTVQPDSYTEIDIATAKYIDMDILKSIPEIAENKAAQFALAELIHGMPEAEVRGEIPEEIQKKLQVVESREKQAEQLKDITDKLEKGVAEVFTSDKYQELLNTMAKFPNYSLNNTLLIMMQKPDAQLCQSFTGWKEMGRFVKKGEKGIKILAPAPYTIQREQEKRDADGKPVLDADGEPVRESVEVKINAFKVVNTFDVSQTEGKELPSLGVNELTGTVEGYAVMFEALKQVCPVPVEMEDIKSGAKGYYHQAEKRIALQEGMSEVQTVKTLIHEMAHQKLHDMEQNEQAKNQSRGSKEVEAESVAYTICQHYGIETSDYSFSYVAGWSDGKEMKELKASLDTIRRTASEMISDIEEKLEMLVTEQTKEAEVGVPAQNNPLVQEIVDKITEKAVAKGFEVVDKKAPENVESQEEKKPVEKKKATKKKEPAEKKQTKKASVKEALKENKEKVKKPEVKKTKEICR
ncbi:MAG: JAB domain-containing protein [Lachnospiraceae bacterium]|nr:JAB domain-containing protein [Lachnospiraceae bacterium]